MTIEEKINKRIEELQVRIHEINVNREESVSYINYLDDSLKLVNEALKELKQLLNN